MPDGAVVGPTIEVTPDDGGGDGASVKGFVVSVGLGLGEDEVVGAGVVGGEGIIGRLKADPLIGVIPIKK